MTRVTLQTIADAVGVSRMTVSNAFSRPDQLSAELRERILATASTMGYTGPDPSARALARGSVGTIGLMLTARLTDAFTDEIATRLLVAISAELEPSGRGLTLLGSSVDGDIVPARDVPLDGALVYSCDPTSEAVDYLKRRKLPLVFVDQQPEKGYPCLNVDDRGGARLAAQHLIDLGHRRIALVTRAIDEPGPMSADEVESATFTVRRRFEGWIEALAAAGIEPLLLNATASTEDAGRDAAQFMLGMAPRARPTAVLAYSDRIAQGVMQAAQDADLDVPGDLSVIGFDDAEFARRTRPALTTVRQDVMRKGSEATSLLVRAIASRAPQRTDHRSLPTELIVRSSTARPSVRRTTHRSGT